MPLEIKFAYVCQKKFEELAGTDKFKRYCDSCRLEVINLDPLDERARLEVFKRAAASPERVCVAATVPVEHTLSCLTMPPPRATAGLPAVPPPEKLREERARLEQQTHVRSDNTPLVRLLSKIRFW